MIAALTYFKISASWKIKEHFPVITLLLWSRAIRDEKLFATFQDIREKREILIAEDSISLLEIHRAAIALCKTASHDDSRLWILLMECEECVDTLFLRALYKPACIDYDDIRIRGIQSPLIPILDSICQENLGIHLILSTA